MPSNTKEYNRKYREEHREKARKYQKKYYKENHEELLKKSRQSYRENIIKKRKMNKEYQQIWRKNNPEKVLKQLLKKYDLSHEGWLKIWENQNGKCAICGKPFLTLSQAFIDHNHETGKARGLLCVKCNSGIGFFDDIPRLLMNAAKYLKRI